MKTGIEGDASVVDMMSWVLLLFFALNQRFPRENTSVREKKNSFCQKLGFGMGYKWDFSGKMSGEKT